MKIFFTLFLYLFVFVSQVFAHGASAGPSVSINGETVEAYFLGEASVYSTELTIPNDIASGVYAVGEEIEFVVAAEDLEEAGELAVSWDFGDGSQEEGKSVVHAYTDSGSYFLKVEVSESGEQFSSEVIMIHIVPNIDYELPEAVIQINGERATVEDFNILEFDLADSLSFDGSGSDSSGSEIVSYAWDFGDDKTAEGATVDHRYVLPQAFATVLLRVTDDNGLIDDAIVNVRNSGLNEPASIYSQILGLAIPGAIVILIIGGGLALFRKKNNPTIK